MYIGFEGKELTTNHDVLNDYLVVNLSLDSKDIPYNELKYGIDKNIAYNTNTGVRDIVNYMITNMLSRYAVTKEVKLTGIFINNSSLSIRLQMPDGSTPIVNI